MIASDVAAKPIRKAMNPAFSPKALLEQEPMLRSHIGCLVAQMIKTSQRQATVDICTWSKLSMIDMFSDFVFGEYLVRVRDDISHERAQFIVDFSFAATLLHRWTVLDQYVIYTTDTCCIPLEDSAVHGYIISHHG